METILMSMHPKWAGEIFYYKRKANEIRKTCPEPPFKVVVYCTKLPGSGSAFILNGKVIGEFIVEKVTHTCGWRLKGNTGFVAKRTKDEEELPQKALLSIEEIIKYAGGTDRHGVKGLHITAPKLYDNPKELSEFRKPFKYDKEGFRACQLPITFECESKQKIPKICTIEKCEILQKTYPQLTKAPQSWQYIQDPEEV